MTQPPSLPTPIIQRRWWQKPSSWAAALAATIAIVSQIPDLVNAIKPYVPERYHPLIAIIAIVAAWVAHQNLQLTSNQESREVHADIIAKTGLPAPILPLSELDPITKETQP